MDKWKVIGTFIPIESLVSNKLNDSDQGTFKTAEIFLDWLAATRQSAWQFLPLHETQLVPGSATRHVASPYKSYGIGLNPKFLASNFGQINPNDREKFEQENSNWLPDYALFISLRDHFGTDNWRTWDENIRNRDKVTLDFWRKKMIEKIDEEINLQYKLHKSYSSLKRKARENDIELIGDLPFYVSVNSPLAWMYQDIFQIENGEMEFVSGVPYSPTAHFGRQIWGHPLYKWDFINNGENIESYWHLRLLYLSKLFDVMRLDHSKAFFSYGIVNIKDAKKDTYAKGPGYAFFRNLVEFSRKNNLEVFVEDTGESRQELRRSQRLLNVAGIKMYRYAYEEKRNKISYEYAKISNYGHHTVAYTSTHDTETLLGYLAILTSQQKIRLSEVSGIAYDYDDLKFAKIIRDAIIKSPAERVIIPIQDWLLSTDRINVPGTENEENDPNWKYQIPIPIEDLPIV